MTQRISDDILESLIARHRPERRQVTDLVELDLRDSRAEASRLQADRAQMDKLTAYILMNFTGEWDRTESAADVAIRHLARLQVEVERLKALIENSKDGVK